MATWKLQADILKVHGYNMFRRDRNVGRGGGVLFYVKDSINCAQIHLSCVDDLECIVLKLTLSTQMSLILIGIYRPASTKIVFYDKLNLEIQKKSGIIKKNKQGNHVPSINQ